MAWKESQKQEKAWVSHLGDEKSTMTHKDQRKDSADTGDGGQANNKSVEHFIKGSIKVAHLGSNPVPTVNNI